MIRSVLPFFLAFGLTQVSGDDPAKWAIDTNPVTSVKKVMLSTSMSVSGRSVGFDEARFTKMVKSKLEAKGIQVVLGTDTTYAEGIYEPGTHPSPLNLDININSKSVVTWVGTSFNVEEVAYLPRIKKRSYAMVFSRDLNNILENANDNDLIKEIDSQMEKLSNFLIAVIKEE